MKKFISCFLVFTLLFSTTPIQVFAQRVADLPPVQNDFYKKKAVGDYKPAMSFEYDYYEVGKISPKKFIEILEDDLLNYEDYNDPESVPPVSRNLEGTPDHLRQSYNDFLYYNIYPEESPLWNYTGLIPEKNGTAEVDVLRILDYHLSVSEEISELFAQNPEYKKERREKHIRLIPVYIILLATFYISWEVAPELVTSLIPYFATTGKVAGILKAITSFAVMIAFDALVSDQVAWHLTQSSERLKYLYQSVGSYRNSAIKVSRKTDLLRSVKETEYERIDKELKQLLKGSWHPMASGDPLLLKRYFKKGYGKIDPTFRPHLKKILGEFLYDLFDGDEILINEYLRKELLRTYYALEFIRDELKNTDDPLRYDRAIIDLATTYKIQNIQIVDGRIINRNKPVERSLIEKQIISEFISTLTLILDKRYVTAALLEEHLGSARKAQSMLNMLETRGIITKKDLSETSWLWDIDFNLAESQLEEFKNLPTRESQIKVQSFGENLQQLKGKNNPNLRRNIDFMNYIDSEIENQLGAELAGQTSVAYTYPTMLTRAEVNYLVQLMDIPRKKAAYEEEQRKQIKSNEAKQWVEEKVSKRANQSKINQDALGLNK